MFKKYYIMVENTIMRISGTAWMFAFLIPLYFLCTRGFLMPGSNLFWENLYREPQLIQLWGTIAILILLSNIGIARSDDASRYLRMGNRKRLITVNILSAFVAMLLYLLVLVMVYALYFRFRRGMSLANEWSSSILTADLTDETVNTLPAQAFVENFSPIGLMAISLLFTLAYCMFLTLVSMAINAACKQSVGSILCTFIILATSLFGSRHSGEYSLFPDYNGSLFNITEMNHPANIWYAIPYWVVMLGLAITLYALVMRRADLISISREDQAA